MDAALHPDGSDRLHLELAILASELKAEPPAAPTPPAGPPAAPARRDTAGPASASTPSPLSPNEP